MTSERDAESAIKILALHAKELREIHESGSAVLDFGIEELRRWDDRIAGTIEEMVGVGEADRFRGIHPCANTIEIRNVTGLHRAMQRRKAHVTSLVSELRNHPEAVFDRQARHKVDVGAHSLTVAEIQSRLLAVLAQLRTTCAAKEERQARIIVRFIVFAILLVLLWIIVSFGSLVANQWDRFEPYAWMVGILFIFISSAFSLKIPFVGKPLHGIIIKWLSRCARRIVDLDEIEAILNGPEGVSPDSDS